VTGPRLASWCVDAERQAAFVALSGDANPLHVDPIAARRLPFGRVAVHGVHLLLDALDRIVAESGRPPHRIRCTFRHSVGVSDGIVTSIDVTDRSDVRAIVTVDVWTAADIRVELGDALPDLGGTPPLPATREPEVHTIVELAARSGEIAVAADTVAAAALFPQLSAAIGPWRLAELVSLTRLVGMHVPGRHSLFSRLDVTLGGEAAIGGGQLRFEVTKADERFSQVVIDVAGPTITGTVTAFVRPEPVDQTIGAVRPESDEFSDQRWLVIGGSRGLGAAAVELLVAGAADVRFTYLTGADDAERITERCPGVSAHQLDVLDPAAGLDDIAADGWQPTHLAYMATPPIFDGVGGTYSDALRARFRAVYVDAFVDIVEHLRQLVGILWPSSAAVEHDVAGMAEYADAKRAGERACRDLAAAHPGLTVHTPRLPRLPTDQSTSFVPTEFGETGVEMLQALRGVTG
jgi:acyl dehydratase